MNNFTYRSNEEKDNLEAILRQRKRKFNIQQWIARIILFIIVASLTAYVVLHVYYTDFDGYVHVDENEVRTPFDIYLDSVYVKTGDVVYPGDTLYSYYIIDMLVEHTNPNREPSILASNRELQIKHQTAMRNIAVLRVKIGELQRQIEIEDHNISFGLSSNSHKLDLERELKEAQTQLSALYTELSMLGRMRDQLSSESARLNGGTTSYGGNELIYDDIRSDVMRASITYHLSSDSSIVTNVVAPDRTILFQKEMIMTTQHLDLENNNLCVIAFIPVESMHRITNRTKAEVRINSEYTFTASVMALGLRTDEIPENLRSYFAKKNTALIAMFKIDPGQTVPFWCLASGLPVDVRVKNSDTWHVDISEKSYFWYTTGEGLHMGYPFDNAQDSLTYTIITEEKAAEIRHYADSVINARNQALVGENTVNQ